MSIIPGTSALKLSFYTTFDVTNFEVSMIIGVTVVALVKLK